MHGLIIREPWIGYILDGTKTWEMRTSPAPRRGRIALIRKGTGLIVGNAELVDSLSPLDATGLAATRDRHRISAELDADVFAAGWVYPWVLHDVRRLTRPIRAGQKPGQVIWVPLDADLAVAVETEVGEATALPTPEMGTTDLVTTIVSAPKGTPSKLTQTGPRITDNRNEVLVKLTEGAIRNGNLSVRKALHLLPEDVVGGPSRDSSAARQQTVVFHPGETVETDVAGDKMLLRCRGAVVDFYARSGAKGGDLARLWRDSTGLLHVEVLRY